MKKMKDINEFDINNLKIGNECEKLSIVLKSARKATRAIKDLEKLKVCNDGKDNITWEDLELVCYPIGMNVGTFARLIDEVKQVTCKTTKVVFNSLKNILENMEQIRTSKNVDFEFLNVINEENDVLGMLLELSHFWRNADEIQKVFAMKLYAGVYDSDVFDVLMEVLSKKSEYGCKEFTYADALACVDTFVF